MAYCQTEQWGNSSPYIKLTVTETASTETTATLTYLLQYIADYAADTKNKKAYSVKIAGSEVASGSFDIDGKTGTHKIAEGTKVINKTKETQSIAFSLSFDYNGSWSGIQKNTLTASGTISVAAKKSYKISYNTNGGSGTFADQTKWHAESLTIRSGKPTRSGYTFKGWALTKAKADAGEWYYQPESTCGKNESLTLYAVWAATNYTVSYNANGGSGAPEAQTKAPDATVEISSTVPTRSGYVFKGWSKPANSSTVLYRPGDNYTTNANITLYAVWVAKPPPGISNFSVDRCNSDGTLNDEGEYALVKFDYSVDAASVNAGSYDIKAYEFGSTALYTSDIANLVNKESDSVSVILGTTSKLFDVEKSYTIKVEIGDVYGYSSDDTRTLGESADSLEFIPNNAGIRFPKAVQGNVVGLSDLVAIPANANLNTYTEPGAFSIATNAIAETIVNIPEAVSGRFFVAKTVGRDGESNYRYRTQIFLPYVTTRPIKIRNITKDGTSAWEYGDWKILSLPTKDITFTPASGVTVNRCMLCRNNDIVTMYLSCKLNAAITANTQKQIGTIASEIPEKSVATVGLQANGTSVDTFLACWVQGGTGYVYIRPSTAYTANTDIEFNLTWNVAATWS